MNTFCTITTADHLYKVYALADSLNSFAPAALHVLVIDSSESFAHPNCRFWQLRDVQDISAAPILVKQYARHKDKLRWSLKPVLLQFLLRQQHASKAIYLDNDLFFYNDYQFLFDLLEDHSFLLTPHYYKDYPDREQNWLEANFRVGLYNAGFVGVSAAALRSLDWWAACCAYRCQKNSFRGLFDDQKYLDLIPVREPSALVLRHQGCNVAGWNQELCVREKTNGQLLINGEFPIVFIHFNPMTIREILSGKDRLLQEHYKNYISALKLYRQDIDEWSLWRNTPTSDKIKYRIWKWFTDRGL